MQNFMNMKRKAKMKIDNYQINLFGIFKWLIIRMSIIKRYGAVPCFL